MKTITNEQIEWMFTSPGCRGAFYSKLCGVDSYCAIGKVAKVFDFEFYSGGLRPPLNEKGESWLGELIGLNSGFAPVDIYATNDSSQGNFEDNHIRAIKLMIQELIRIGYAQLETDKYAHEFANLSQEVAV